MPPPDRLLSPRPPFVRQWLRSTWPDVACMAVVGAVTLLIYYAPIPSTRTFPVTFRESGDIVYPQWAYPYRGWVIPAWQSGTLSIAGPIVIYIAAQARIQSAWDMSNAIMGTAWSALLGSLFQVVIKQLIGGFRPYFLAVCMPDISLAKTHNETGLNGVGFQQVMYTTEICTQPDASKLKNAVTSFPSGHSTAAFAGFGFLFLWLNAKLKVWADYKPKFWKLALTVVPLLAAVTIACSLTIDAAHNWYDIVAGSVIGGTMALASYRTSYAAVWDWRYNHVPLLPEEAFDFVGDVEPDSDAQTITRSAGWGGARRDWLSDRPDSARSSTLYGGHASGRQNSDDAQRLGAVGQAATKRRSQTEDAV